MEEIWQYFEWSPPEIGELEQILDSRLKRLFDSWYDPGDGPDCDAISRTRRWWEFIRFSIQRWSTVLQLSNEDATDLVSKTKCGHLLPPPVDGIAHRVLGKLPNSTDECRLFLPLCLETANDEMMRWLKHHPKDVDRIHHRTFEVIVSEVVRSSGWQVELTKMTRDGGYDMVCMRNDQLGFPITMVVETKLYRSRTVGLPMVDRLVGAASRTSVDKAMLVTNSFFSRPVWKEWQRRIGRDLELVDRDELLEWLGAYPLPRETDSLKPWDEFTWKEDLFP